MEKIIQNQSRKFPWWKYMFDKDPSDMDSINEYKKELFTSLTRLKLSLLIGLIIISLVYQIEYIGNKHAKHSRTYANGTFETKLAFILDVSITFVLSMGAVIFLYWSRLGWKKMVEIKWQVFYTSFMISLVLTLFVVAQELSGYKRWSKHGEGMYKKIDEVFGEPEDIGDAHETNSFLSSLSIFAMILFLLLFLVYSVKIIIILTYAFKRNKDAISGIPVMFGKKLSASTTTGKRRFYFGLELFIVCTLFSIPFIISPYLRKEEYDRSEIKTIIFLIIITVLVQTGLQYTDLNPK